MLNFNQEWDILTHGDASSIQALLEEKDDANYVRNMFALHFYLEERDRLRQILPHPPRTAAFNQTWRLFHMRNRSLSRMIDEYGFRQDE